MYKIIDSKFNCLHGDNQLSIEYFDDFVSFSVITESKDCITAESVSITIEEAIRLADVIYERYEGSIN